PNIPFCVFKVTGIAPLGTLEKLSNRKKLDAKGQSKCSRIRGRIGEICEAAHAAHQPIFIDAEESWIQDAIDRMADEMMSRFNRTRPIIHNTIQMYRTDRLQFLRESRKRAKDGGYILAVKIVRGAYMEKERGLALEKGYRSPIQPDKESTDTDYNLAIDYCLRHLDMVSFVAGTHNEESTQLLVQKMREAGIKSNDPHICFSQLYGMSDNLSYVLAENGYNVSKYVPYGPIADTIPYLIRRAEENTSVAGQMSRELEMISSELERRRLA
ncbi:MAG: proline dehydrogenase family protein, partial [Acidobacteria bacterium]|nr:proline dehydrogenase family protein [Acidobacteriota bacterium]